VANAQVVVGVGSAVAPDEYDRLTGLLTLLDAELVATRRVTDQGWQPRSRQVGITGRSIAPRLYIGVGLSGRFNHMVGVRGAGMIVAINNDPAAEVFDVADIGITTDWREGVEALTAAVSSHLQRR
jgi:electron transfer flavoprotein alpha subunit